MITDFKIFEKMKKKEYHNFNDDFNNNIKDIKYYINVLENEEVDDYNKKKIFYWSCANLPELAILLPKYISIDIISKDEYSIAQLPDKQFKSLLLNNDDIFSKLKLNINFFECIIRNSDVKKLKILKELGIKFNQKLLVNACFKGNLPIVKFLISEGLDPNIREKSTFSKQSENCLDIATSYNDNPEVIKYLVELNVPVTYRHMYNVISKNNIDALDCLIKSNNLIDDYSYSNWAIHDIDKYPYGLSSLTRTMIYKDLIPKLKIIINKTKDKGYEILQMLPRKTDLNRKMLDSDYVQYLNPEYLELAYYIIDNYDQDYENSYTTEIITKNNEKFWLRKMKKNPSIISKLRQLDENFLESYDYQKIILTVDTNNLKYIKDFIHPKIKEEFNYLIDTNKYNI